jgi:hypothetical protein
MAERVRLGDELGPLEARAPTTSRVSPVLLGPRCPVELLTTPDKSLKPGIPNDPTAPGPPGTGKPNENVHLWYMQIKGGQIVNVVSLR